MHPIGQNVLLIYPHFGFDFLHRTPGELLDRDANISVVLDLGFVRMPRSYGQVIKTIKNKNRTKEIVCAYAEKLTR